MTPTYKTIDKNRKKNKKLSYNKTKKKKKINKIKANIASSLLLRTLQ